MESFKLVFTLSFAFFALFSAIKECHAKPTIKDLLNDHPDLIESEIFAKQSGVLNDIEADEYGGALTLMFPSNEAWDAVSKDRRDFLLDPVNKSQLETLLLFSTTDSAIFRGDVDPSEPIYSLLGVEAYVKPDQVPSVAFQVLHYMNQVCVTKYDGNSNEIGLDCAYVLEWDIEVSEGVVFIIDKVLYPQELLEDPNFPSA